METSNKPDFKPLELIYRGILDIERAQSNLKAEIADLKKRLGEKS